MHLRILALAAAAVLAASLNWVPHAAAPPFSLEGPGVNPDDFRVTVFADGLDFPLGMAELPDGSILATVNAGSRFFNSTGSLIRLVDTNGDGVADGPPKVLYDGLPGSLTAVRLGGSLVFAMSVGRPLAILRLGESLSDPLTFAGQIQFQYDGGETTYHAHSALEVRETPGVPSSFDLFFQMGSDSNFSVSSRTAAVSSDTVANVSGTLLADSIYMLTLADAEEGLRMTRLVRIGKGLRNAAGLAFHPATGDLYFQDNGIDGLSDPNEPHSADELNHIAREAIGSEPVPDFGFPDNYIAYRTGEVVGGEGVQPVMVFQPIPDPFTGLRSEGPNDITFAPPAFPPGLNRGIFIGFHGKFNLGGVANDENPVVYANPETGEYFHFIHGQQAGIGHLDGLLSTRDSLFVADLVTTGILSDGAGRGVIYQIKAIAPAAPPVLEARRSGTGLELAWDRGVLEESADPDGPWQRVENSFSPHLVSAEAPRRFYRAVY